MSTTFHQRLLTALLVALSLTAFPAFSHANHSWGGYHWARTSSSFTLKLGDNVSAVWDSYLATASNDWSFSTVLDTAVVSPGGTASDPRKCRPTSGRVEVCSYKYGTNGWLGIATIWVSGKHITQGTVKMNDSYFDNSRYPKYNSAPWRNMVMCQEIGHTLGLDHQDETFNNLNLGTCMDYTNYPEGDVHGLIDYGPANEQPDSHDYDQLVSIYIYNHNTDSFTTVKQSVNGKLRAANHEPDRLGTGQWGKLVRSTNHGRTELYELDLGRGHKVLTHVIWADPEE